MGLTFEAYRRQVLKELTKLRIYKNFHVCVAAFAKVDGLDRFAESLFPLIKSCWQLGKSIEFTAQRIDTLTEANMMVGMLYAAEDKMDRRSR
jgi:hypothetical protein